VAKPSYSVASLLRSRAERKHHFGACRGLERDLLTALCMETTPPLPPQTPASPANDLLPTFSTPASATRPTPSTSEPGDQPVPPPPPSVHFSQLTSPIPDGFCPVSPNFALLRQHDQARLLDRVSRFKPDATVTSGEYSNLSSAARRPPISCESHPSTVSDGTSQQPLPTSASPGSVPPYPLAPQGALDGATCTSGRSVPSTVADSALDPPGWGLPRGNASGAAQTTDGNYAATSSHWSPSETDGEGHHPQTSDEYHSQTRDEGHPQARDAGQRAQGVLYSQRFGGQLAGEKVSDEKLPASLSPGPAPMDCSRDPLPDLEMLIYLSCGYEALERDARALVASGVWRIDVVKGFWFFPFTDSLETLVVFRRVLATDRQGVQSLRC
jgi:hypothetical protein